MSDLAFTDDAGRFYRAAFEEAIAQRDAARTEVERLKAALYKIAEDAEVAHQGGLHNDGKIVTQEDLDDADQWADEIGRKLGLDDVGPAQDDGPDA